MVWKAAHWSAHRRRTDTVNQIDTAVADRSVDHDEFLDIWRSSHPGRVMRTVITLEYEFDFAYIILHHQCI